MSKGDPYGNNGYNASQYAFSVQEDKLAVSYFLDHVYRFNVDLWLRPNLNEPGIFGLGARNRDLSGTCHSTSVKCHPFGNKLPTLRRIIRGKVNEQHANCRDFPLPSGAAAGLLLAFIEQLIDGSMHYSPVYLPKTTDIRLCCEQRIHELAIFFLAFGVKLVNAV